MRRNLAGGLRSGIMVVLVVNLILKLEEIPSYLRFDTTSTADFIGQCIGAAIGLYLAIAFFTHYISQILSDFKNTPPRKISYITIPGILFGVLAIGLYLYRIHEIVTAIGVNQYVYYYIIMTAVLSYLTICDYLMLKSIRKQAKETAY
jgi:hypothetical protein